MDSNKKDGVIFEQPKADEERREIAQKCVCDLKLTMPCVVDGVDNRVDTLYAGWPERIYVIDADGRIAYASQRGPWGFKPKEVGAWLRKNVGKPARVK